MMPERAHATGPQCESRRSLPTYLKAGDVMRLLGVRSRKTFARMLARGAVPPPLQLGPRTRRWNADAFKSGLCSPGAHAITIAVPNTDDGIERLIGIVAELAGHKPTPAEIEAVKARLRDLHTEPVNHNGETT